MGIINTIDGNVFAQMMISGANNLYNHKKEVDDLNVFPVPDGDTGTNMSMTIMAMAKALNEVHSSSVTKAADTAAFSTLRGARGNSGVILSQLMRGISKRLKGLAECTPVDFSQALKEGVDTAYRAVMNPTEGTILTVSREAAVSAVVEANKGSSFSEVINSAVLRGNRTLEKTQDMLPALKQAGVVDAGGQGWMFILEGMLFYLKSGEAVPLKEGSTQTEKTVVSTGKTHIAEQIRYMYCTEFIVEKKISNVNVDAFRRAIENKGDCMLVIDDEEIVKVHIHTNNPGYVLERAVKMGDMINIKIDNMKYQHETILENTTEDQQDINNNKPEKDSQSDEQAEKKKYAFAAVCAGDGMAAILKDLGIDRIIPGGQSMNPSTEDILNAVHSLSAETIFIFPNNKNIILAANQAKAISSEQITVIPTETVPECISAMLAFQEHMDVRENETRMTKATHSVKTGQVTYAVRDTMADGKQIHKDDVLGMHGKQIACVGEDYNKVCLSLIADMIDEDTELLTIYYGEDVFEKAAQLLCEQLEQSYPDIEVSVKDGGQPLYYYIIAVE